MVFIQLPDANIKSLQEYLKQRVIIILAGQKTRLVTHLDINEKDIHHVIQEFKNYFMP